MEKTITVEKVDKYLRMAEEALGKMDIIAPQKSQLRKVALDWKVMVEAYLSDARHFYAKGDYVNCFACLNYLYGWIDAGARLGLWDVGGDNVRFTLDD